MKTMKMPGFIEENSIINQQRYYISDFSQYNKGQNLGIIAQGAGGVGIFPTIRCCAWNAYFHRFFCSTKVQYPGEICGCQNGYPICRPLVFHQ